MKTPNLNTDQFISLLYVAAFFIALFVVYKVLGKLGIINTRENKNEEAAATELRTSKYFDPLLLKGDDSYTSLGSNKSKFLIGEIHSALSGFGTDEEKVFTVFGSLQSKRNISELALNYLSIYKKSLISELLNELSDAEQLTLYKIINNLPK